MVQRQRTEKNQTERNKIIRVAISVGLWGGIIWGGVLFLVYYLQFSDVGTSVYAKPFLNPDYILKWQGHLIGLGFFIIYSIIFSLIYALLLRKLNSPWVGIGYGILLWAIIFLLINPMVDLTKSFMELGANTNSVLICTFILYGLFVGYTISLEFNDSDTDN